VATSTAACECSMVFCFCLLCCCCLWWWCLTPRGSSDWSRHPMQGGNKCSSGGVRRLSTWIQCASLLPGCPTCLVHAMPDTVHRGGGAISQHHVSAALEIAVLQDSVLSTGWGLKHCTLQMECCNLLQPARAACHGVIQISSWWQAAPHSLRC
jgi:hypothetical protein